MTTTDPKDRILKAAELLFDELGLEAVSLRSVTTKAGVNIAAVNYYFGSKAALLEAMTQRFFQSVNVEQLRLLQDLSDNVQTPSVHDLLVAYTTPIFKVLDGPRGGEWVQALMMARNAAHPGSKSQVMEGESGREVTEHYYETLRQVLPYLPADELWWRFERTHSLLMANQGRRVVQAPPTTSRGKAIRDERAWLITFLAGALQAAATCQSKDGE
jgi:AcrR family transcriptional regulator